MGTLSYRWEWFGFLVKEWPDVFVKDRNSDRERMKIQPDFDHDLQEEARLDEQVLELGSIRQATIERKGDVSIEPMK